MRNFDKGSLRKPLSKCPASRAGYLERRRELARLDALDAGLDRAALADQRVEGCFPPAHDQVISQSTLDGFDVGDFVLAVVQGCGHGCVLVFVFGDALV